MDESTHCRDSYGTDATMSTLKLHLRMFKRQKSTAQKTGRLKKAILKAKHIQLLSDAIERVSAGASVDINSLPNPMKNQFSVEHSTPKDTPATTGSTSVPKNCPVVRKSNYCILCQRLVKKFSEHVEINHPESEVGQRLRNVSGTGKMRRLLKMKITDSVRKKWNAVYNRNLINSKQNYQDIFDYNKMISVKKRYKLDEVPNVSCVHCEGLYRRDKLSVHLKSCASYIKSQKNKSKFKKSTNALKHHSRNVLPDIKSVTEAFKNEILRDKKINNVLAVAIGDPLIMKFGSDFHKSRRAESDRDYVMRVVRDMTKLFMKMKEKNTSIKSFKDILNPVHFEALCDTVLEMGKYDPVTGIVKVPSVAYRLSQPLKEIATLAKSELLGTMYAHEGECDRKSVMMIDDFLDIINKRWKNTVGRIFTKSGKKQRVNRTDKLALEDDIMKVACFIEGKYESTIKHLKKSADKKKHYDALVHMIVVHAMLLVRRRPVDFKHASLQHYMNIDRHDELLEISKGYDLTAENLADCKRFHIFYVPGKNLEIVPIVFTPVMKKACDVLIGFRDEVGITSDLLFSLAQDGFIKPTESIKLLKGKVQGLKKPNDLTGNGLRHQAATFSRLKSTHPQYQDYLASTLGHTLAVHKKHYELPMGILQKIIVCPILHKIMTAERGGEILPNLETAAGVQPKGTNSPLERLCKTKHARKHSKSSQIIRSDESDADDEDELLTPSKKLNTSKNKKTKRLETSESDESESDVSGSETTDVYNKAGRIESAESEIDNITASTEDDARPDAGATTSFLREDRDNFTDENALVDASQTAGPSSGNDYSPTNAFRPVSTSSSSSSCSSGLSVLNDDRALTEKGKCTRTRWTEAEQAIVLEAFGGLILKKEAPARGDIVDFMRKNPTIGLTRTVDQVVMFVRNYALRKQLNVTPTVKKYIKRLQKIKKKK